MFALRHGQTMNALMPGYKISNNGKILVNMSTSNDKVVFNIGGTKFETFKSTLRRMPQSPLANDSFMNKNYHLDEREYFFDRDPDVFKSVLQYLRTGELHISSSLCGSAVKAELEFWGISELTIEDCCWLNYNSWTQTLQSLTRLETDRKKSIGLSRNHHSDPHPHHGQGKWETLKHHGWEFLSNPNWSISSKIYGAVSIVFVFLSIISFVSQTHETFRDTSLGQGNTTDTEPDRYIFNQVHLDVHTTLFIIDCICFSFFALEMILRFTFCPSRLQFCISPMNIVDFLALLPDFVAFFAIGFGGYPNPSRALNSFVAMCRIVRVFRIFRLMRFLPGLWLLFYTLKSSINELLQMLVFVFIGMLVFATLIYYAEDRETFPNIPRAFWWAIITMTTVGYGEVVPVTNFGYLIGSAAAICGPLLIGFTVPVLVNNFILYYSHCQSALERESLHEARYKLNKKSKAKKVLSKDNTYECIYPIKTEVTNNVQTLS